ncbi:hypothetical protein [Nocardioides stalactiti]|uniref:hypothetical protein n=1 Tax=Nocardioides stalactiti TaxID=2755356 RepID=UPI0015FFB9A5|nr:hypothetical protein [Nocardioides stalactiti]
MTESYEVYRGPGDAGTAADAGSDERPWHVAVEYANDGQAKPPTVVLVRGHRHESREGALRAAHQEAFGFQPPDPFAPQGRQVFRDGPDGFLVVIQGAMSMFHMSVRVVQHVGDA